MNLFGSQVTPYSAAARRTYYAALQGFIAAGADPATAARRAYAALFGIVQKQAAMVAFVHVFRMLGYQFPPAFTAGAADDRCKGKAAVVDLDPAKAGRDVSQVADTAVEDQFDSRELYAEYLNYAGFQVVTAINGHEAIGLARMLFTRISS